MEMLRIQHPGDLCNILYVSYCLFVVGCHGSFFTLSTNINKHEKQCQGVKFLRDEAVENEAKNGKNLMKTLVKKDHKKPLLYTINNKRRIISQILKLKAQNAKRFMFCYFPS